MTFYLYLLYGFSQNHSKVVVQSNWAKFKRSTVFAHNSWSNNIWTEEIHISFKHELSGSNIGCGIFAKAVHSFMVWFHLSRIKTPIKLCELSGVKWKNCRHTAMFRFSKWFDDLVRLWNSVIILANSIEVYLRMEFEFVCFFSFNFLKRSKYMRRSGWKRWVLCFQEE